MLESKLNIAHLSYEDFCKHFFNKKNHVPKVELIRKLKNRMHNFEEKYGMTTEEFIMRYEKGEFEMDVANQNEQCVISFGSIHNLIDFQI